MSLAYAESDSYNDGPHLEPWQYPAQEQLYCSLPLREGQQTLDFALEGHIAMVNEQAVLLLPIEQRVLDILLRNRDCHITTETIFETASNVGLASKSVTMISKVLGEIDAKLCVGDDRFLDPIKLAGRVQAYRIVDNVVYTGTIKESERTPLEPAPLMIKDLFWYENRNCGGASIYEMIPENDTAAERRAVEKYCGSCSVKESCLTDALINDDHYGARGNTTGIQRERLLRVRRAQEVGYVAAQNLQLPSAPATNVAKVVRHRKKHMVL